MTPTSIIRYLIGNMIGLPTELRIDPLGDIVEQGKHPSPSQIREHRGEDTVRPLILSDAVFFLAPRRNTGDLEISHLVNTEARPTFWNLGYINLPVEIPVIYTHDWGERSTLGGNYAVIRLVSDSAVIGLQYDGSVRALTNFRGTLLKQLEERLHTNHTRPSDVTRELKTIRSRVGSSLHQLNEYVDLKENVEAYLAALPNFGWESYIDREEATELLRGLSASIGFMSANLIPGRTIRKDANVFFDDLESHAASLDSVVLDSDCRLGPTANLGPDDNPLMHILNHLQYSGRRANNFNGDGHSGSYLESLLAYSIRQTRAGDPLAHAPILVKIAESTDNLRKEATMTALRSHMTYHRAMGVADIGDRYLQFLGSVNHPQTLRIEIALNFHKSELLKRVMGDYIYFKTRTDTDQRKYAPWVGRQFRLVRDFVGEETEHYMVTQLEGLRRLNWSERDAAEELLKSYADLSRRHQQPGSGRSRPWTLGMF